MKPDAIVVTASTLFFGDVSVELIGTLVNVMKESRWAGDGREDCACFILRSEYGRLITSLLSVVMTSSLFRGNSQRLLCY